MDLGASLDVTVDGSTVTFALTVTNREDDPRTLVFPDGQVADVVVTDREGGGTVWTWSEGRLFTQALRSESLAPWESFTEDLTWSGAAPGAYEARAELVAREADVAATAAFEVPE